MSKELEPFIAALQLLDIVGYEDLPTIVNTIKSKLEQYESDQKLLGQALNALGQNISNKKDVKPQALNYFEDLICQLIKIVIRWDFRVGYQALTYIFSPAPDFYKNANVDMLLAFPIGKDRPLKQYTPKVGQQCDVVRPYVSSVSLCGWTRCKVLEIEGNKYTYKFHNAQEEQPNTREKPWFAPLGTRMKDYDWRMALDMGSPVQALLNRIWYKATIAEVSKDDKDTSKRVKVTFRRFAENGDRMDAHGNKFFGHDSNQDQWMDVLSPRIQQCGKMVDKDLCYYSHAADELIVEDQYDMLFEEEYNQKPFGAIARVVNFKSISLLTFVATFVQNGGIEKTLQMLDTCTIDNQYLFTALAIVGFSIPSIPKMHLKNVPLEKLYNKIVVFLMQWVKSLILIKIDVAYFCYNMIGRRIYSLSKMHQNQNQLRKMIIRQFLKMNMEKKMIALRYIHDLVFPKRPLGQKQNEQFHKFLKDEKVFQQIFSANTHEQIITRAGFLLNYMIKHEIISSQQFESLWTIVPVTDTRGRVAIQKLLTETSKNIPISFAQTLIDKILQLKETELTVDNLNLLKQLKNRQLDTDTQMKILTYLWDILTVKSVNIKTSMQEQVEKVFKVFVSTIKDNNIKAKVLDSMVRKLQDCKKVKNQIQLLKDFIQSYPDKKQGQSQMIQQKNEVVLETREQAIQFLKSKQIYIGLMNLLFKSKDQGTKKDILLFFSFLFQYDKQDVNEIVRQIYQKMGPTTIFLEWVQKNENRLTTFIIDFLQNTTDFAVYENLSSNGFDAINEMIINVNKVKKNIKVITTYKYNNEKSADVAVGPVTGDATTSQKKQQKMIGPVLPQQQKHIYVLVSPFKLIGMKFLQHILHVVKQSTVYNSIVKSIIQFISNLDESIQAKTLQYRKQFLFDIVKQIKSTVDENKFDPAIKTKLEVYINLLTEIFSETEKNGLGDLLIHSEQVEGQRITLNIDNLFDKEKTKRNKQSLPKIKLTCNENITIWSLKKLLSPIICQPVQFIDIIKYTDPMKDTSNGKSLSDLLFYDNENIKISKKPVKMIPRCGLLNDQKTELSQKFQRYVSNIFDEYKNKQSNALRPQDLEKLSKQKWKGALFKKRQILEKVYTDFDTENKGWLTYTDFKKFLISKASKNQNAVWILINLSGYKNNFTRAEEVQQIVQVNTEILPRKILSSPEMYKLIFSIFENETFKQVHLNFYRLLSMLQTNKDETQEIKQKIYEIIESQKSVYTLCYALQVLNSELAKREQFYLDFWKNNGIQLIQKRIKSMFGENSSVYELDPLMKNQILPGFMKVFNMYVSQLLWKYKIVRFISQTRINYLQIEDFVKKINQVNQPKESQNLTTNLCKKLQETANSEQILKNIYQTCEMLMLNLINKFLNQKSDYLSKLTSEVVRLITFLVGSRANYHNFQPLSFTHGVKSLSLNIRRSTSILIYAYLFHSEPQASINEVQKFLTELLNQIPHESKVENSNYFSLLNQVIKKYLQSHPGRSKVQDQFFINLGNSLLNQLFTQVEPQNRTAIISDKIILGILNVVDTLVSKHEICLGLSWRLIQITEKCLFAYNIEQKLKQIEIKPEMLTNPKQQLLFKNYVICKTEQNRDAAYNIVAKMHSLSPAIEPLYMNNYIMPIVKSISPDARLTDSRSSDVGIKNFGSTCYMNSMLQVLNSVGPFRNTLMKCQSDAPLVMELKNLFAALFYSQRMDYAPANLLTSFVPPINPGLQQDTTQFLNFLFDQLESSLQNTKYKKLLDQIFKGKNTAQMICHSCGYKKQNQQQFFSFGVEIQNKFDLQAALQGSYQGQIISDYLCDSCQNRGETTKRNILSQIPSVLFIHLRRIVFNYDMFVNMKIHTRLQFPEELNIEPYTKQGVQLREQLGLQYIKNLSHNEEEMKKFQVLAEHGKPKDFYKLKLKGVIVHSGSADVGHYYSILPQDKSWRKYDDSRVTFFGASSFETECYGGTFTSQQWGSGSSVNAYVLVYEKVIKNSLQFEAEGQMTQQISIPYDEVKVYNSPEDYRKLWLDNHNFMLETQLLQSKKSKGFINFLYKLLNDSPDSIPKAELIAQIIYRISYHSGIVGDLLKILTANPSLISPSLLHSHVLNDKVRTFKLLFSNDKPVRQFMASFLHLVLIESYKKGDELVKADVTAYIVQMLNGLTGEVAKNWLRVDGYFSLLNQIIRSSIDIPQLWKLFMERRFISTLIDYVMEKQSPVRINPKNYSLGTKSNPMDFSSGISIISFYLKHSYGLTGKNYEVPAIPQHFLFHLNDNDVLCLSYIEFYRKMLRERQNIQQLSFIIQRLCIMNLQFSKAVCEVILETICSITDSKDQMQDLSNLVLEVLKIRDDYWTHRAEMLLGIAYPFVVNQNVMSTFDEQRYVFSSTIYDVFPVQCLFSYIYIYRLKNTVACFYLMSAIIQSSSVSDIASIFLLRQPSPSYLYPSYLSWMRSFIQSFMSFLSPPLDAKNKQRIQSAIDYTNKYVADLLQFRKDNPDVDYYRSVITGQIISKNQIQCFEKDGIQIKLYQYQVYCAHSQPTDKGTNAGIETYLDSMRLKSRVKDSSNILKFIKQPAKAIALGPEAPVNAQQKQLQNLFDTENSSKTVETSTQVDKKTESAQKTVAQQNKKQVIILQSEIPDQKVAEQAEVITEEINLPNVWTARYFRQLELVNKSKQKKVIKLMFSSEGNPNMILPKEYSWKLFPKNNQSLWLAKQDYEKDWGKLQMKSVVQEYVKQKHEKKNITYFWFKTYGEKEANIESQTINRLDQMKVNEQPTQTQQPKIDYHQDLDMTQINCPVCTCLNPTAMMTCEVCGSPLH